MKRSFKGTKLAMTVLVRQHRVQAVVWLVSLVGASAAAAAAFEGLSQTGIELLGIAAVMQNPAMVAMLGPAYPVERYTLAAQFANEMLLFTAIAAAVMNILLVSSFTRQDEEEGRLELIRSLPVGRFAYLAAGSLFVTLIDVLLAVMIGLSLGFLKLDGMDWNSSLLYGTLIASTGWLFGGLTAVFSQIFETTRGVTIGSFAMMLFFYLIRAIGDVLNETLSYFSPLGWTVRANVFDQNHWQPVFILVGIALLLFCLAFFWNRNRDLYAGLLPDRKGKRQASSFLLSPFGLTLRLEKGSLLAWGTGIILMAASFGAVMNELETYLTETTFIQAFLGGVGEQMTSQFIELLFAILSVFTAVPAVMVLLKLKKEEKRGYLDNVYSRTVSRSHQLSIRLFVAWMASILIQLLMVLSYWGTAQSLMEQPISFSKTVSAGLAYLPAIWVLIGLTALLVGAMPKGTVLVWAYIGFVFADVYLGELLKFPEWVRSFSVFYFVPAAYSDTLSWLPLIGLTVAAFLLAWVGDVGYRKRDILPD